MPPTVKRPIHTRKIRCAFMLIELIVSIAVIAVLATLVMHGLSFMRERSNMVQSIGNMRSIGASTLIYAQEHDGELPVWHDYNRGMYWWQQLRPYCSGDNKTFGSPAHAEYDATDDNTVAQTISYGWNYKVLGRHKGDPNYETDSVNGQGAFARPTEILVLTDGPRFNCWGFIDDEGQSADENRYGNGLTGALFLDGHVEALPVTLFRTTDPYFIVLQ